MNIILVGFMASGKTTIARIISKKTFMKFMDTDRIIEKQLGLTISEIFDKKGEGYFREFERRIIRDYLEFCNNCVVSTGGGMPCFFDNMDKLKSIGWVVWLKTDFNSLLKRVNSNKRPLFKNIKEAKELYEKRVPCYSQAHFMVETTEDKYKVAKQILNVVSWSKL